MDNQIQSVITQDPSGEHLVRFAEGTADSLVKRGLTRSQIRNIFTEMRQIEALWATDRAKALRRLNMLRPKLDYQTERHETVGGLKEVLSRAIELVNQATNDEERSRRFRRLMELFEAILAYHHAKGGKK